MRNAGCCSAERLAIAGNNTGNLAYTVIDVLCTLVWSVVIFGTVLLGIGNQVLGLGFWAILAWFCVLFFPMAAMLIWFIVASVVLLRRPA